MKYFKKGLALFLCTALILNAVPAYAAQESTENTVHQETMDILDDAPANKEENYEKEVLNEAAPAAETATSGTCGAEGDNLTWSYSDGVLTIRGNGEMENYENFGPYAPWHLLDDSIRSVIVERGVTTVGDFAFWDCINLTSITLPEGITSIGYRAFRNCNSLTSITLPEGITSIGNSAFDGCSNLKDVFYNGSEEQWKQVSIDPYRNDALFNAVIHFMGTGSSTDQSRVHTITVSDGTKGLADAAPVSGAKVQIDSREYLTKDTGTVRTEISGVKTVAVSADGYRNRKELYNLAPGAARIIPLEKEKNDGLPYVVMCSAKKDASDQYVDLRSQTLYFTKDQGTGISLWLEGNWNGHGKGTFHLIQDPVSGKKGKVLSLMEGGAQQFAPGRLFDQDRPLKLQMVAADGTKSEPVVLNLKINKAPVKGGPTVNTPIREGISHMDWLGNYPIRSNDEIFTKLLTRDMSISSERLPVEVKLEHNDDGTVTYKGLIGFRSGEFSKNILNNKTNEKSSWTTLKKEIKDYKNAGNPAQYFQKLKKKYGKDWHPTKLRISFDAEVNVCGFVEVTFDSSNQIVESDGGLLVNAGGAAVFGQTFFAGPVPLYYEFKPGAEVEVSGGIHFSKENENWTIRPLFQAELALPSISLEGGLGVRNVATAGLNGSGKLKTVLPGTKNPQTKIDLVLDGSVHIKLCFVADYKWSFASTRISLYPKKKSAAVMAMASQQGGEVLSLASRGYLKNETPWNSIPKASRARSLEPSAVTLQTGVLPDAMPKIHQVGDQQIMLFLRDLSQRAIGNHTQLVYSISQDGVWSQPRPVWESETADFFFDSASDGENLVVAWQKASAKTDETDPQQLLQETVENSEICCAVWDPQQAAFTKQQFLTDNRLLDKNPSAAVQGDQICVSWVCNDANDVTGDFGNDQIFQAAIGADGTAGIKKLYETADSIAELSTGITADGSHLLFAAMNDQKTMDLYSLPAGQSRPEKLTGSENPSGLSFKDGMFLWQNDGKIERYLPGGKAETFVSFEDAGISSSYEYAADEDSKALLWTEASEDGYELKASMLCQDTWSAPVTLLKDSEDTAAFMDAIWQENGKLGAVFNTVSYDADEEPTQTALKYAEIAPQTSISLELAEPELPDSENGTQEIHFALENKGSVPIRRAELAVNGPSGELFSETVALTLLPGESEILTRTMQTGQIGEVTEATAVVRAENDIDPSDNEQTLLLGQPDLALSVEAYEQGDEILFALTALNRTSTPAEAKLRITEDSENGAQLHTEELGTVTDQETVRYLYSIDRSRIDFGGNETKSYFFTVSSAESDWNGENNVCIYTVDAPVSVQADPDGTMEELEMVAVERIEITEQKLELDEEHLEGVQLHAKVFPENASITEVFWSAENRDIVHITADGFVTPLRNGTTTVTASLSDHLTDTVTVTVRGMSSDDLENPFSDVGETDYFFNPVLWAVSEGITSGIGNTGKFQPDGVCSRAHVVTFLWKQAGCPKPSQNTDTSFKDVAKDDYFYDAVLWAVENDITQGVGNTGRFEPYADCTRAHVVTFLWRAAKKPDASGSSGKDFPDVSENDYFYEAMRWAVEKGVTNGVGTTGKFMPDASCTRANAVTFMYRAAGQPLE